MRLLEYDVLLLNSITYVLDRSIVLKFTDYVSQVSQLASFSYLVLLVYRFQGWLISS
jgi:hypothetical protein